jgi:hypothetical protein
MHVLTLAPPIGRNRSQKRQGPDIIIVVLGLGRAFRLVVVFRTSRHGRRLGRLHGRLGLVRRRRGAQFRVPGVDHLLDLFAIFRGQQF